jgi:photosystem II stability/assembly factor-like uncharacterized protein
MKKQITLLAALIFLISSNFAFAQHDWKKIEAIPPAFIGNTWLDVYFLPENPDLVWICGFSGMTLRSTDGGESFLGSLTPRLIQLESIHFVSDKIGFCSGPSNVFKTTDGGATWEELFDPGFYTDDSMQPRQYSIWGCVFLDEMNGMAAGGDCVDHKQFFFKTTDGGAKWNLFTTKEKSSSSSDILLYPHTDTAYGVSSGVVWISEDKGDSWKVLSRTGGKDWHEEISVFGNTILLPYSNGCSGDGVGGGIRIAVDFGKTWDDFNTSNDMYGTFLHDEKRGWACGSHESIYYTSDGGENWILSNCGVENDDSLDDIIFANDSLGWCVGSGIYKTHKYEIIPPTILPEGPLTICGKDSIELFCDRDYEHYRWSTGETTKSIVIKEVGTYWLRTNNSECDTTWATNEVEVLFQDFDFEVTKIDTTLCEGDSIKIFATKGKKEYFWSNGSREDNITAYETGTYHVSCIDTNDCEGHDSIFVEFNPIPKPEFKFSRNNLCVGDSSILKIEQILEEMYLYNAETGEYSRITRDSILTAGGEYYLLARNKYGCIGISDTLNLSFRGDSNRIAFNFLDKDKKYYDFDSIPLLEKKCIDIELKNIGGDTEVIEAPYIFYNIFFNMPRSQFPIVIPPFESRNLRVCFSPDRFEDLRDTLMIKDNCSPQLIPLVGTARSVTLTSEGPCGTKLKIKTVGLEDWALYSDDPYPNPARDKLEIQSVIQLPEDSDLDIKASVIDLLGNRVTDGMMNFSTRSATNKTIYQGNIEFDTSHLESGAYLIVIRIKDRIVTYPIIIAK